MTSVGGAVLAGGASTRMGRPKAFIEIDGHTLLDRAVDALRTAGTEPIVVVGGDQAAVEAAGHRFVADEHPSEGPLGGIVTALGAHASDLVVVLACDLLDASSLAVTSLIGALGTGDVAVPVVEGRPQWLHAVWRRSAEGRLRAAFEAGERAPRRALDGLSVVEVLDGSPCWYADADTPADLPPGAR
ncbi:MAG: molybdenum cofactor guanylyltransferase [Actinomycetota bacterium]